MLSILEHQISLYFNKNMLKKRPFPLHLILTILALHAELGSCAGIPKYDTLGFAPSNSTGICAIAFGSRSNFNVMATVSSSSSKAQPVIVSHREATSYKEVAFLFCTDCTTTTSTAIASVRFNSDASSIFVAYDGAPPALRISTISDSFTLTMVQKIPLAAQTEFYGLSKDDNFLMVVTASTTNIYKLALGQYVSFYSLSGAVLNRFSKAMTPDGLFLLQDLEQTTANDLRILAYNGTGYERVSQYNLGFSTSTIYRISIG